MISKSLHVTPQPRATRSRPAPLRAAVLLLACLAASGAQSIEVLAQPRQGATGASKPAQPAAEHCQPPAAHSAANGAAAAAPIPDVWVTDQDGNKRRFYSDLVKGKVVAINFVFTSCAYICPMQGKTFGQLQASLGDRLGRDVHLVSVSTDPTTDTPERLKAWAAKFGARPGWTLVTGERAAMDELLLALTGDPAGQSKRSPIALVGDLKKGALVRAYALAEPENYLRLFAQAAAHTPPARPESTTPSGAPAAPPPRN
jgi:protein SCO1/2